MSKSPCKDCSKLKDDVAGYKEANIDLKRDNERLDRELKKCLQEKKQALDTFVQQLESSQNTFNQEIHRIRNDVIRNAKSRSVSKRIASRRSGGGRKKKRTRRR
tara:strand:+ start:30 stop:341 length:312 start_codon:yes stop_codon:yes gene_type:complete